MKYQRVAIYLRVSTSEQSTDLQRRELTEYCLARNWLSPVFYEDMGMSGTSSKRPDLQRLMKDAQQRRFDIVLVWKLDRFARSLKDLVTMIQDLADLGILFISLKDQLDLTTSSGRLMTHLLGAFAEFEASLIRERVKSGIANARAKGRRLGRPQTRDDASIRRLRSEGFSLREICKRTGASLGAVQRSLRAC